LAHVAVREELGQHAEIGMHASRSTYGVEGVDDVLPRL